MMSLENMIAPDSIGVEKGRYLWNGSRHRVMNHLLALLCICVCIGIVDPIAPTICASYPKACHVGRY